MNRILFIGAAFIALSLYGYNSARPVETIKPVSSVINGSSAEKISPVQKDWLYFKSIDSMTGDERNIATLSSNTHDKVILVVKTVSKKTEVLINTETGLRDQSYIQAVGIRADENGKPFYTRIKLRTTISTDFRTLFVLDTQILRSLVAENNTVRFRLVDYSGATIDVGFSQPNDRFNNEDLNNAVER